MKLQQLEIHSVDAKRWALLHLPLGICLGIWFVVWYYYQEQSRSGEVWFVLPLGIPFVAGLVCCLGWLQAVLMNCFIWCTGGPVLYVKPKDIQSHEINPIGL